MIAYFPHRRWFNRLAGLTVGVGLVWYYLAPTGSTAFTLAFAALFLFTVALGAVIQRFERRKAGSKPEDRAGDRPVDHARSSIGDVAP